MGYDPFENSELSNLPPEAFSPFDEVFDPQDHWLETANKDEQLTAMREWFHLRYCDPAHETPYSSEEGGYIFIHGGPYDPADVLSARFSGTVDDNTIQEVIDEMYDEVGDKWAPIHYEPPDDFDYDERFDLRLQTRDEPLAKLKGRLQHARRVLALEGDRTAKLLANNLVFGAAIAALEAFLWETVDYYVEHEVKALRDIVTKIPALKDQPMKLGDIFDRHEGLKDYVKGYLQNLVWHRWDKVVPLFKFGLGIQPPTFKIFDDALVKRHDIVHRSGYDKMGNPISVTPDEIYELCEKIEKFATELDKKLTLRVTS